MRKTWIAVAIAALAMILFFAPKEAGRTGGGFIGPGDTWTNEDCSCFGVKFKGDVFVDGPMTYRCAGIPHSCACERVTALDLYGSTRIAPITCE